MAGDRLVPSALKQWQNIKPSEHGHFHHANRADCNIACVVHQRAVRLVISSSWAPRPTLMPDQVSGFFLLHKRHLGRRRSILDQPTQLGLAQSIGKLRRSKDMLLS